MDGECTGLKACFVIIILLHCTLGIVSLWQVFSVSVVDYASKLQATSQQYGKCKGAPPDFKGGTPTYSSMGGIVRKGALGETVNLSKILQDQWLAKKRFTDVMKEDSENTLTEKVKGSKWEPFLVLNEGRGNKRNPLDVSEIRVVEPFPTEGFTFNAAAKDEFLLAYRPLNIKNLNILVDFYEDEKEDEETISRRLANMTESFWNNQARRLSRIIVKDAKTKAEEKVAERKAAREQLKAQRAASKKARARRHQKSQAQQVIQGRPGFQCRSLVGEKYLHAVYANARPFGRLCFLLLPFYGRDRPQVADGSALAVALHFMGALAARGGGGGVRLGFNSLGACASVNHLHFQVCAPR
uniref:GDPGP1-like N-terminal domain-containing protein n=1 Tax=Heterosigma akashiwo TaxID=2829 RepID=A0A6V2QQN2_HETAK